MIVTLKFEPKEAAQAQAFLENNLRVNCEPFSDRESQKFGLNLENCMVTAFNYDRQEPFDLFKDCKKGIHWNEFEILTDKFEILNQE